MDTLFFAFANYPDSPLRELKREDAEINHVLAPLDAQGHFKIMRSSFTSLKDLAQSLDRHKKHLVLFHFSGHAGSDGLQLEDKVADFRAIAKLLGKCKQLKLVILNGCATIGLVKLLREKTKKPVVIATHRSVDDTYAADFAIQFYESLSNNNTIEDSFDTALAGIPEVIKSENHRSIAWRNRHEEDIPCWGIDKGSGIAFVNALHWRLPVRGRKRKIFKWALAGAIVATVLFFALLLYSGTVNNPFTGNYRYEITFIVEPSVTELNITKNGTIKHFNQNKDGTKQSSVFLKKGNYELSVYVDKHRLRCKKKLYCFRKPDN